MGEFKILSVDGFCLLSAQHDSGLFFGSILGYGNSAF